VTEAAGASSRISVIIPAWNAESSLPSALESVLAEQDLPFECLVVDDASTDRTAAIVRDVAARDPRVRLIEQPANEGVSAARNRGLDEANGEWLLFLDADDRLLPGGLRALAAGARGGALAVVGQRISTDGERRWVPRLYDLPDIRRPGWKSIAANPGLLYYAAPHGKLIHASVAAGLRFSGRVMGDQPWILRALLRAGDRILVIGDVVYEWRRPHPDRYQPTITAARERSATLAAAAVEMAGECFRVVTAEIDRVVEPAERDRLALAYFDRLVSADLSAQLSAAVRRRDPSLDVQLEALSGFVASVPGWIVWASDSLMSRIVRPPAASWWRLSPTARSAYGRLLASILDAPGPRGGPRPASGRQRSIERLVLQLARRSPWPVGAASIGLPLVGLPYAVGLPAYLAGRRLVRAVRRRVRRS
jgi:hypothetical protein